MQFLRLLLIAALAVGPTISMAQGFKVAFGEMQQDSSLPVEVTADNLSVNQNDGSAVFLRHGTEISLKGDGGPTCLTRPLRRRG